MTLPDGYDIRRMAFAMDVISVPPNNRIEHTTVSHFLICGPWPPATLPKFAIEVAAFIASLDREASLEVMRWVTPKHQGRLAKC
ncbi:hypothetical protein D9615_004603 [Tricholomella constricta]|uniref:Uncharacterized protein n=1 Tax=Tricholomella constricta TaxID=117010 RepID=A0A8H5M4J7_9AGAR|nr:hypothetical protein D9615_004603 [Tricholomella constricta]